MFKFPDDMITMGGSLKKSKLDGCPLLPADLHRSDCIHLVKKLGSRPDHPTAVVRIGPYLVVQAHIRYALSVYDEDTCGIYWTDALREDRQNFTTWSRLTAPKLRKVLKDMQSRKDNHQTSTEGTLIWLQLLADLQLCYWSQTLSIRDRLILASKTLNSLRIWRMWIKACPATTLRTHFFSRESFQDALIELNQAINAQYAFGKFSPRIPHDKSLGGSDPCERVFSNVTGGHGVTNFHCKDATMLDVERNIEKSNSLLVIESRGRIKHTTKVRRKAEFLYELHEDKKAPPVDLLAHPTLPQFTADLHAGLRLAHEIFEAVPHVKNDITKQFGDAGWKKPWLFDFKWTHEMGDASNLDIDAAPKKDPKDNDGDAPQDPSHGNGRVEDPEGNSMDAFILQAAEDAAEPGTTPVFDYGDVVVEMAVAPDASPPLPPVEDPSVEATLLELVDDLEGQLAAAVHEGPIKIVSTMVTPTGRYSKKSLISRKNKSRVDGIKLDLGRLRKITLNGAITAEKREKENQSLDLQLVEQEMAEVTPGDFIALAFEGTGEDSVWLQKVVRMRYEEKRATKKDDTKQRKVRDEVIKKASLKDRRAPGLFFLGSWLTPIKGRDNMFAHNHGMTCMEPTANDYFSVSAYLGHCDVDVYATGPDAGLYYLSDPSQMARFTQDAKLLQKGQESAASLPARAVSPLQR